MAITVGSKLGRYEIRSKLGAGGMGEVYLAEDTRLNRKVALKRLPDDLTADESAKRRFIQEAKTASALNHPHIITVYDISSDDHHDFIAMEYVEGETTALSVHARESKDRARGGVCGADRFGTCRRSHGRHHSS